MGLQLNFNQNESLRNYRQGSGDRQQCFPFRGVQIYNVSHSHHKTKRKFSPNLKNKRFWSEEEGRWITLKVSAAGIKTINKKGLAVALREAAAPKKVY